MTMTAFKNFLQIINDNWTTILVIIGLTISIVKKTMDYFSKSDAERVEIAKKQIAESMLKMISDAEVNWNDWMAAGSIKRSEVIKRVFDEYPILSKVADQEELVAWIDAQINESLKTLREVVAEQM